MSEPKLPSDPEDLLNYYMLVASAKTLTSVHDFIQELLTFKVDELYSPDSREYKAVADSLESVRQILAIKQNMVVANANKLLE